MPSERVQRQIDRLLDEAEGALVARDWDQVRVIAGDALRLDPENGDAKAFLEAANRDGAATSVDGPASPGAAPPALNPQAQASAPTPTSFANGRYAVKRFLGEGGKKKVYLAHDSLLDRDVAFALIKTEGLDDAGRVRVQREAQAMGRLGNHPNIVTVYDIGEESSADANSPGQPYLVLPILSGGDVEGVIEKAAEHKLPLDQALRIAIETCQGLELAHGKGIVHRDLKPGNVWLTEDGRAMIGDFGLAVAADRSRLTQAGMMVGTVSYMPPEQAMGGEVGPRSDLYSLGAMLYEMVCGRPPFVGDESVAIIGQHLNTPPVAPTWHRPDCPPALEALILRLLEKDPGKRPESATIVKEALQAVGLTTVGATLAVVPGGGGAGTSPAPTFANDPLYRRTFVGRENEVRQLQQAFDGAMSGNGALVMVVGEPGIGKTAICEQLATYVALRGGKALVGHCYEEGSLSLPYLAFVEAMRSYVLAREPDGLRSDLGTGAADVARIVSEVRDRVQGVELRPAGDPEDDRWRLLQSVTSFLRNASTVQPLVIVLEDLHWADRGSLDLLLHVARNLQGARLLIIGNYRDVEVDRTHPLSGVLADLRRINSFASVRLRGLTVDEVHRMYEAVRGQAVPWGQAEAVYRQTEGNPLFVQEVLRYLVEEGIVVREGGRYVAQQGEGVGMPEGLRDVVGKRLSRLSAECNRLLAIASVIGRDFRLDTLRNVAGAEEDGLVTALEEATRIGVLEEQTRTGVITYRFSHAFFRQTLYEELSAPRRLRFHQGVARALESQYAMRRQEHAAELAEHFSNSTDRADLAKAVEYGELAAQRAISVFDYGEAVRLLEKAIDVQEVLDPDDKLKRCDLLLALAEALNFGGWPRRTLDEIAQPALDLAETMNDRGRASMACQLAMLALFGFGAMSVWGTPEALRWTKLADQFAEQGTAGRVRADIGLARVNLAGEARLNSTVVRAERARLDRARELARALGDETIATEADNAWLNSSQSPQFAADRLAAARRLKEQGASLGSGFTVFSLSIEGGLREEAEQARILFKEATRQNRRPASELTSRALDVISLVLDGQLEEAVTNIEGVRARGEELGLAQLASAIINGVLGQAPRYLGRFDLLPPIVTATYGYAFTRLGHPIPEAEARAILDELIAPRINLDPAADETPVYVDMFLMEGAVLLNHVETARVILRRYRDTTAVTSGLQLFIGPLSISRVVANAAAILGEQETARGYYNKALTQMQALRHRPEIALTHLDLAELLLEHYPDERHAAIEHLDFAIAELRDMKMQPALERALRHRGLLKA